jgi:hypothetical protein
MGITHHSDHYGGIYHRPKPYTYQQSTLRYGQETEDEILYIERSMKHTFMIHASPSDHLSKLSGGSL